MWRQRLKGLARELFVWGTGLLVIWTGLGGVVLRVAGTPATATVTYLEDYDPDDGYGIDYVFWTADDSRATGTVHVRVGDEAELPPVGAHFPVLYLRWAPFVSQPAGDCRVTIFTIIFVASGVYWLYLMNKPTSVQQTNGEEA